MAFRPVVTVSIATRYDVDQDIYRASRPYHLRSAAALASRRGKY